eukprot:SAG31_NODE_5271_length_2639_cov_15.685902_3_plen_60_part_00
MADSDQPTKWNVFGFVIVVVLLTAGLLVPARVTTECTKMMADLNAKCAFLPRKTQFIIV